MSRHLAGPQPILDATDVMELIADMHDVGVGLMRRRLVKLHGRKAGLETLRAWMADDESQGPGRPAPHRQLPR